MKKALCIIGCIFFISIIFFITKSYAAVIPRCPIHGRLMTRTTNIEATCTMSGLREYYCRKCKNEGTSTTESITLPALGHRWTEDHECTRCGTKMNGHWFSYSLGSGYRCIVCDLLLKVESISPTITERYGYRVVPYDHPTSLNGNIVITFNAVPYNSSGSLMKVAATSTAYNARNAMYHWGEAVPDSVARKIYPTFYKGGKDMDTGSVYNSTVTRKGTVYSFSTPSLTGRYIFNMTVGGISIMSQKRYTKGNPIPPDPPTPESSYELEIKHVDKNTGKEIIDEEYTKKETFTGDSIVAFSLPISETKYLSYCNVSYKIDDGEEIIRNDENQYAVKVPNKKSNSTITFYYSKTELNIKHVLENTGEEIIDKEYTKTIAMNSKNTLAFSLDIDNKYPILYSTGYAIDGVRTNEKNESQFVVSVPRNGSNRTIIFYYKYTDINIDVNVKHIDVSTGNFMTGTTEIKYNSNEIPVSVNSLKLANYPGYRNTGVYMDGKYTEKNGTTSYSMAVDISNINYSKTYSIIFYYSSDNTEPFTYELMDPIPAELSSDQIARIASNTKENEIYEVKDGIPTSENVYVNVRVYNYILRYGFKKICTNQISKVKFVQPYRCNEKIENISTTYEIPTITSYYKLDYLEIYNVESATIANKVLPGESVKLTPTSNTMPTIIYEVPETHISGSAVAKTITLPTLEIADMKYAKNIVGSKEYAEYEIDTNVLVRNDKLIIDGKTVTDSEWISGNGKEPEKIIPSITGDKVLYKTGLTISDAIKNGEYTSEGSVTYSKGRNINGTSNSKINKAVIPNNVVVHTPVVDNAVLNNNNLTNYIQKAGSLGKSGSGIEAKALVLDETFKIEIPNNGVHRDIKGYKNRIYNYGQGVDKISYAKGKQIKFPFDVYYIKNNQKIFIPNNTWYDLQVSQTSFEFLLPVWVKEGTEDKNGNEYYIETRVVAENASGDLNALNSNESSNLNIESYIATKKIFVEVLGRLFDFEITGTNDPAWTLNSALNVSNIPIGQSGQNKLGTAYKYALKLGYSAAFDVKTKGTKSDSITIKPLSFWYVDKDTNKLQEVDLYYHSVSKKYIKIGSIDDKSNIIVNLSNSIRNVPASEKIDSARIQGNIYNYTNNNNVGTFGEINLPMALRMSYNNISNYLSQSMYGTTNKNTLLTSIEKSGVNEDAIINSIGHFYGEYILPASTLAVSKGESASANSKFLTNGYIIVNLGIESQHQKWTYLSYDKPIINTQWVKEKYSTNVLLPNGNNISIPGVGCAIVYEANLRSSNEYEASGTH